MENFSFTFARTVVSFYWQIMNLIFLSIITGNVHQFLDLIKIITIYDIHTCQLKRQALNQAAGLTAISHVHPFPHKAQCHFSCSFQKLVY
jgi:hypothetical protein